MPDALNRANQHHPIWFVNCLTNINNLNETAKLSLQKIVEIFSNKSLHDSKLIPNVVLPKANGNMKTIEIKGTEYWAAIEDSNIVLESLKDRIVFEGGGAKIEKEAEESYYKTRRDLAKWNPSEFDAFDAYSKTAWIEEYIDEKIIEWCKENLAPGKIETYNLN